MVNFASTMKRAFYPRMKFELRNSGLIKPNRGSANTPTTAHVPKANYVLNRT